MKPVGAAMVLGMLGLAEAALRSGDLVQHLVLAGCTTFPLAFVRWHLSQAASVVTAGALLTLALGGQPTAAGLVVQTVVLVLVGIHGLARTALVFAMLFVAYAVGTADWRTMLVVVAATAALAVGSVRRLRAERAERTASVGAQADLAAAYAAREERARIARELHDLVAHHISSISVQADTTRLTTPGLPPDGASQLLGIAGTARLALTEMRRLLGVLRDDADAEASDAPQPGLGELITLVDEARTTSASGIRLIIRGQIRALEPGLELTAYRIVQEALTNCRKHAPGAAIDVEVGYDADALRLSIWDAGDSAARNAGGLGLLGMGERVAMAGGTLCTGRSEFGGFVVQAILPTARQDR